MKEVYGMDGQNGAITGDVACCLLAQKTDYKNVPQVIILDHHPNDSRTKIANDQTNMQALASNMGGGGNNVPLIMVKE